MGTDSRYAATARAFGAALARVGIGGVYGGGRVGLMGAVADAALAEGGEVIGIIPRFLEEREIAHSGVDLRVVESMHERKQLMADLSDAFVALPGGFGTLEEFFEIVTWVQLDKLWALVPIYATFLVPFCTWLMIGFLKNIPRELEEAARVDGASNIAILWRIIFPIAVPGLISAAIFSFTQRWNEYLYALVYMSSSGNKTVSVGMTTELIRGDVFQWGQLMAGALIGVLPAVLVYFFFVEYYVAGRVPSKNSRPNSVDRLGLRFE